MNWLSYLFPRVVAKLSSSYNQDIRIIEECGELKLLVNGSRQSGKYIRKLWEAAFGSFHIGRERKIKNILVLGVAGGTVIHLLHERFPAARITGVDIDPAMINIGKRYFGLNTIPALRFVRDDAQHFVRRTAHRFDLIIVDVFFGREIPAFVESSIFLRCLSQLLSNGGTVVINFLRELEYGMKSDKLMETLQKIFPTVSDFGMDHNRFFAAT